MSSSSSSRIFCEYTNTYYIKCGHCRIYVAHSKICRTSENRKKTLVDDVFATTEAGNSWVTEWSRDYGTDNECISGPDLEPNTVLKVENTYCGLRRCLIDPAIKRTPVQRAEAKLYFQKRIREQEVARPEIQRQQELDDEAQRESNKLSYKISLLAFKDKEDFHVLDMRKFPEKADQILTKFLESVPPAEQDCTICLHKLARTSDGEAVKMPCGHLYHRNCAIKHLIRQKLCTECRREYAIFLFAGFDPTIYATSILSIDFRTEPQRTQPFEIQVAGYIPNGALEDKDQRAHVRMLTKNKLDDKWGDNNGDIVAKDKTRFDKEQEKRKKEWRNELTARMYHLDAHLGDEARAIEALRDFLTSPYNNHYELDKLNELIKSLEDSREDRRALDEPPDNTIGTLDRLLAEAVLDSVGYDYLIQDGQEGEQLKVLVEKGKRTPDRVSEAENLGSDITIGALERKIEWAIYRDLLRLSREP